MSIKRKFRTLLAKAYPIGDQRRRKRPLGRHIHGAAVDTLDDRCYPVLR